MKTIANRGDYLNAVTDYAREWSNEVVITDGVRTETYTSCEIKITTPFSQDALSMGQSFTKELDLTIKEPERTLIYNLATIKVYSKLKVGENFVTVQMGEYFPSEVTTNDDYFSLTIKAYDTMGKLDTPYVPQGTPETTAEVVSDIASQYGITVAGIVPNVPIDTIYEGTVAETLGWVAGLDGKNAIFNDNGHLVFRWYTEAKQEVGRWLDYPVTWAELSGRTWRSVSPIVEISRKEQKERGANLNEGEFTIASITSGTEENPLTVGEGKGISFENPYMTAERLTTIGNRELGKKTAVGTVNTFGNPLLEVGDIVGVIDKEGLAHTFFISNMEWNLTGGCSCIITAIGNADAEIEFSNVSPMEKKITKVKSVLQGVVERFSNLINSLVGYYTITEENGVPTGWTIKDDLNNPQNMIKCSLGGLGISSNGGQTYQTAITGEGIVADTITSGTINAIDITGCTITAESEITFKYTDYSSADLDKIREITLGNINPTVDDFRKLDVDGNGLIGATDYITVSTMITNHTDETLDTSIVLGDAESGYGLSTNGVFIRSDGILMKGGLTAFKGANFDGNVRPIKDNYWTCGASDHRWTEVYATNGTIQTSDIREKKNIETLDDKYAEFFDTLNPVSFEWRKGDTKRHTGFIAQEVEQGLEKSGIDSFGGLVKDEQYSLNYSEFIPILVAEIQRLKARVDELEKR